MVSIVTALIITKSLHVCSKMDERGLEELLFVSLVHLDPDISEKIWNVVNIFYKFKCLKCSFIAQNEVMTSKYESEVLPERIIVN